MAAQEDDPVNNVTDSLKERLKSPFYASWLIAFCAWNWRAIYYLLFPDSQLTLESRLYEIDNTVYPSFCADHLPQLILLPFLSACIAVSVIPWLLVFLDGPRYRAGIRIDSQRKRDDEKRREQKLEIAELRKKLHEMGEAIKSQTEMDELRLREANGTIQGVTKNFTDSLNARNEQQKMYRFRIAHLIKRTERVKNVFNAIADGREWKEENEETKFLKTLLGVVEMGPNGSYVLNEEGKAIRNMYP